MYQFIDKFRKLYGLLQDEQSKEIFNARFALDMDIWSIPAIERLMSLARFKGQALMECFRPLKDELKGLNQANKKIILYGTAETGKLLAIMLHLEHIDFYGFCGRHAERFPDGLFGKPVLSPDELVNNGITGGYYVVPAVGVHSYPEITEFLRKHSYPKDHILDWVDMSIYDEENEYLEFPALYRHGTAFIDGGCYDCQNSYRFAEWCGGEYSSIIAFEPDPGNYAKCCKQAQDIPLPNFQLINAGLSSREGAAVFNAKSSVGSHIESVPAEFNVKHSEDTNMITIRTVAIDDIIGERTVGFIKLDIEGAELDALHGAKSTILRDKPLLAVCVYHLRGDVFAIMDYLHQLLPEYRFLLRHTSMSPAGTILYASVDL